jgi:hypothetical protein
METLAEEVSMENSIQALNHDSQPYEGFNATGSPSRRTASISDQPDPRVRLENFDPNKLLCLPTNTKLQPKFNQCRGFQRKELPIHY